MAYKTWQEIKVRYCDHAGGQVALEAETVYPSENLPDQPPRVLAHRCSQAIRCMLFNEPACIWAGSNPMYDPFAEKSK